MKKILFFSTPTYGHLTAVHPVITHLVSEGNEVVWYCSSKYKDIVSMSGVMKSMWYCSSAQLPDSLPTCCFCASDFFCCQKQYSQGKPLKTECFLVFPGCYCENYLYKFRSTCCVVKG
ncbi:MAG: hypothetical protein MJZ41_06800 [Bacteroidaceae bacterium]|nr:hypothetical protein [Bacteroidaceae bacterium]